MEHRQTLEEWYEQNAKGDFRDPMPDLLYTETVAEDDETITDCVYCTVFLKPTESKSGKLAVAVCRETTVYARGKDGDLGEPIRSETEVLASI